MTQTSRMPPPANPRIGIVIPTFNRLDYLKQALGSALRQTHADVEILVIDNRSTDGTADHMSTVLDPRVRYLVNENNLGPVGNIRKGISLFAGRADWATVLCDDDLLEVNFVDAMLKAVRRLHAASVVHSHRVFIDSRGDRIREGSPAPDEETAFEYLIARSRQKRDSYLTGVFFRMECCEEIGGYPMFATGMATDDAFVFSLAMKDRLVFARDAVASIRIHENAESLKHTGAAEHFRALEEFGAHVRRVAAESGPFGRGKLRELEDALDAYLADLNSSLWLRSADVLAKSGARRELEEFSGIVRSRQYLFRPRVRVDAFLVRAAGWYPETIRLYRSAWRRVERLLYGR